MTFLKKQHNKKNMAGFSFIELVIVLALFFIMMGVTVDIFLSLVQQQRKILAEQELLNQSSYIIEYMSRSLKNAKADIDASCIGDHTGPIYELTHCSNGILEACNGIKFIDHSDSDACKEFFLDADNVLKEIRNDGIAQNISSNNSEIKYLKFIINGNKALHVINQSDLVQPEVTVLLDIKTKAAISEQQEKIVQTTISQGDLNPL